MYQLSSNIGNFTTIFGTYCDSECYYCKIIHTAYGMLLKTDVKLTAFLPQTTCGT